MPEISLVSALLVGLLGGTHCVGMCGGIVGALSLQMPANVPQWRFHLAYNLGRLASYTVAGVLVGAAGASSMMLSGMLPVKQGLYLVANLMLVFLGLYLAGLSHAVVQIERLGGAIWQYLQPYTRKLLPVRSVGQAFGLGALWGWVPCGLVYSLLVTAMSSGSAARGGAIMLAFGVGTLPNLLAMGYFARQLKSFMQHKGVRLAAGLLVAGFGVLGLYRLALLVK
ncbi:MAG: sulfite exporter TauE/SafE family protein [Sulfuricella sp.]|nr:sulfite exporter TauE/SafE family protein [Sulfuricella sp.]